MLLIFLRFTSVAVTNKLLTPFSDNLFRVALAPTKSKTGDESRLSVHDRSERHEPVLDLKLFQVAQRLRGRIALRHSCDRFAEEILEGRLAIKLVNISLVPLIADSVQVRADARTQPSRAGAVPPPPCERSASRA